MRVQVLLASLLLIRGGALPSHAQESAVTGRSLSVKGTHTPVGSYPLNCVISPDGKYVVVSDVGAREYLTVIRVLDGKLVSRIAFNDDRKPAGKDGLYYGLAFGATQNGLTTLYASTGARDRVDVFALDTEGYIVDTGKGLENYPTNPKSKIPHHIAGIALNADGSRLYAVNNQTHEGNSFKGSLSVLNTSTGTRIAQIEVGGFPFAVTAITKGANSGRKVYVGNERDSSLCVVDPLTLQVTQTIRVGAQPVGIALNQDQTRLYVANSGSDTVSVIDTATDRVIDTYLLNPTRIPGLTPTGVAVLANAKGDPILAVTLSDWNTVAFLNAKTGTLVNTLPVGWYPTSVAATTDGNTLFVTNAKGTQLRNPNSKSVNGWGQYIQDIIEGDIQRVDVGSLLADTARKSELISAKSVSEMMAKKRKDFLNPGIKHVIYIIKENRTYDQVLGDLPQGNGDKSLCLFPREVTPNLHALAERFVLLDNFYCCAEVSADGWDWSVSGMVSPYSSRNTVYNYSGRGRDYDFEGANNGTPVGLLGLPDVARAASGYIWDLCKKKGISYRNYGFYVSFSAPLAKGVPDEDDEKRRPGTDNTPNVKALQGHTDLNFRRYDLNYADSELSLKYGFAEEGQRKGYGKYNSPSRFTEWKREFDAFVANGNLPRFSMLRLPRDHTRGTAMGALTPRAMVADNDYAVGQIVEAVSHSPYWKETAICILEDDAQDGYDHVDAHRSPAFVISPFVKRGTVDSRFYNTDSMLATMEMLLGLPPLCLYDALSSPINVFSKSANNAEPYSAIMPTKKIASEMNRATAYRAKESKRLINVLQEESMSDVELNDILWHSIKGKSTPAPAIKHRVTPTNFRDQGTKSKKGTP